MLSKARSLAGFPLALTRNICFRHGDRAFSNGERRAVNPAEQHGLGQLGLGKQHAEPVGYALFPLALAMPFCLCLEITRATPRYLPPHTFFRPTPNKLPIYEVKLSQRVADLVFFRYCFFSKQFKVYLYYSNIRTFYIHFCFTPIRHCLD